MTRTALYVRMSPAEREAIDSAADAKGVSAASLLRAAIRSLIDSKAGGAPSSTTRRKRGFEQKSKPVSIRLSPSELEALNEAARVLGTKRGNYISGCVRTALLRSPQLLETELKGLEEATRELRAVGRNLNQLTRRINEIPEVPEDLSATIIELRGYVKRHVEACHQVMLASMERWT